MQSVNLLIVSLMLLFLLLGCNAQRPLNVHAQQVTEPRQSPIEQPPAESNPEPEAMVGKRDVDHMPVLPKEPDSSSLGTDYRITEQKREYGELRLSVAPNADLYDLSTEQLRAIAEKVVSQYSYEGRLAIFFYNSGRRPDKSVLAADLALCRFDWTPTQGMRLRFDHSVRREQKPEILTGLTMPKYEILETMRGMNNREVGWVLIPSFSRRTPPAERERVARLIMAAEGFDDLSVFATREAFEADSSIAYSRQHPEAKQGRLGFIIDGISSWDE